MHDWSRMPRTKGPPVEGHPSPTRHQGSAEIAAMVARTAPAVLDLLGDGVPRTRAGAGLTHEISGISTRDAVSDTTIREQPRVTYQRLLN